MAEGPFPYKYVFITNFSIILEHYIYVKWRVLKLCKCDLDIKNVFLIKHLTIKLFYVDKVYM